MRPPPPTIRPPKPRDAARERRGLLFSLFFISAVFGALILMTLLGWLAWSLVFWGVARLFGGA